MIETEARTTGLRGRILHAPVFGEVEEWRDGAVLWDLEGRIVSVGDALDVMARHPDAVVDDVRPNVVIPGLVDAHTHLPQLPVAGLGAGELLEWLHRFILPAERGFRAPRAMELAPSFFRAMASAGTTTAAIFLAVWEDSAHECFAAAERSGMRVAMGKAMMDDETYSEAAPTRALELSLEESERLCRRWDGAGGGLLRYAFSPRFAVACSAALMQATGELAVRHGALSTNPATSRPSRIQLRLNEATFTAS
jgi:guanine deaminase